MAYWQWGDAQARHVVVCVHGLSRQGRDFDVLAQTLVDRAPQPLLVICPDVAGRGQSDWMRVPSGYSVPVYAADMLGLIRHLKADTLDWVGTSMGGLIGMAVCAHAASVGASVRKLVLNDVGPVIQWASIQRIGTYLGRAVSFDNLQQAADALWAISSGFGPHTPAQWLALTRHMLKPLPDGRLGLHYDPAIAVPFRALTEELAVAGQAQLWDLYDSLRTDTLLLRGADSDLLSPQTAHAMTQRGPSARLVEFAGVGHAPTLIAQDQLEAVASFLLG
jgi:pimeloyl-ACP methyl ester carboxylesterase